MSTVIAPTRLFALALVVVSWATSSCLAADKVFSVEQIEFFETHVRPLLVAQCYDCHSTDAPELKAALYVDSREGMLKGGDSGPAVVVGKPAESLLIDAVKYKSLEMPPKRKLSKPQIAALEKWVEMGAPWPQVTSSPGVQHKSPEIDWVQARRSHWAWQPVKRPSVPDGEPNQSTHPIDRWIAARRAKAGLQAAPPAEPHILVRRMYVDLIGVPPTPEQVRAFCQAMNEDRDQAVVELVETLLDSPMYGERWGRHWLDVARYSDGFGGFLDNQALPEAWRYRDWVVQALNDDMPIDEFIQLQIAGDLTDDYRKAVATGFFALGPTYRSDGGDPDSVAQAKGETLDDRMDTLTRGLLGLTGSCARCHDHKFDPIPQRDYYALAGVFNNTAVHNQPLADDETVQLVQQHNKAVAELDKRIKTLEQTIKKEKREATAQESQMLATQKSELDTLKKNSPPGYKTAHTLRESGSGDMKVAIRGNLRKTGELAPRQFLRILSRNDPVRFTQGSGRAELAAALIDSENPLTARVFVNRVWLHHFGDGLVRTPSNFGTLGEKPTHPLLLDWLASEFVADGWSLKNLHRQIMTSESYQMSSRFDKHGFESDGDNRLLWRMSPRRMDVEAWRDALLTITGELDLTSGGPPQTDITSSKRRTLYAKVSRNGDVFASDQFLRRFDFPLMRATVAKRPKSIVPQQFLFLMNSSFMVERAKSLVARLQKEATTDEARVRRAYELLYSRPVDTQELLLGLKFLSADSSDGELNHWTRYAQVLLSSNEFMYVR